MKKASLLLLSISVFVITGFSSHAQDKIAKKLSLRLITLKKAYQAQVEQAKKQAIDEYTKLKNNQMDQHNLKSANRIQQKIELLKGETSNKTFSQFFTSVIQKDNKRYESDPDLVTPEGEKRDAGQGSNDNEVDNSEIAASSTSTDLPKGKNPYNQWGEAQGYNIHYVGQEAQKEHDKIFEELGDKMGLEEGKNIINNYNWILN